MKRRAGFLPALSIIACLLATAGGTALAAPASPAGLWRTIDDETGQARSLVRIEESAGQVSGRVERILTPGKENARCEACTGDLQNQPIVGMTILQGLKAGEDGYEGGTILDPNNGKTYRCQLWLDDGGKKLNVRGYIALPVFGRSQVWHRAD